MTILNEYGRHQLASFKPSRRIVYVERTVRADKPPFRQSATVGSEPDLCDSRTYVESVLDSKCDGSIAARAGKEYKHLRQVLRDLDQVAVRHGRTTAPCRSFHYAQVLWSISLS